jgi:acetyltransferase-like isoleucine patch superfamily enzyme
VTPLQLRALYAWDRLRFALWCRRFGDSLSLGAGVSPNLRFARLRIEPGGRLEVGDGLVTERQPGNHLWVQAGGRIALGSRVWLRTEHECNRLTVFPEATLALGDRVLLNGAMLHAKQEIHVGDDSMIGFGSRIFDADLHPLDLETPERVAPVRIGQRVWIGSDVTVMRGVQIGDDVAIGARSVVTRDLPSRVLALGAPAKPVRDIGRRHRLDEEGA